MRMSKLPAGGSGNAPAGPSPPGTDAMGEAGAPGVEFSSTIRNSQSPFRFAHRERTICGRGYSGSGLSGVSAEPQRVIRRAVAGRHGAGAGVTGTVVVSAATGDGVTGGGTDAGAHARAGVRLERSARKRRGLVIRSVGRGGVRCTRTGARERAEPARSSAAR